MHVSTYTDVDHHPTVSREQAKSQLKETLHISGATFPYRVSFPTRRYSGLVVESSNLAGPMIGRTFIGKWFPTIFESCAFRDVQFGPVSGRHSRFVNTAFDRCSIGGRFQADFADCLFEKCRFESCDIRGTSFVRGALRDCQFVDCRMAHSNFAHSHLQRVDFSRATFQNVSIWQSETDAVIMPVNA